MYICSSTAPVFWITSLFSYKGLLHIVAMFMAFHTRKAKIKTLINSEEIYVIVVINSLTLILLLVMEFLFRTHHLVYSSLFALALFVEASIFLGFVFVPKVNFLISYYKALVMPVWALWFVFTCIFLFFLTVTRNVLY